ncbi:MAG: hypothetical protein B7Y35_07430 [Sphingomonadales bacterium 28-64-96]|nr:MAG: hypothetical protein B7Y35_07430 [Sphingomonadales bacterium 28-64-96]
MTISAQIERVIANWRDTVGSKPAKTQSVITRLTHLRGVEPPAGSNVNDAQSYYDLECRVFENNGGALKMFGRIAA